ncbi:hypothetical protein BpHYR1_044873 [Brachionus plicatilis]|uniref:Uncharacterized protein n=1 Tax=Brachionus plicatilis TaxID=10195 RepID=A0A3M7R353_BRAPC|nr:hypothetical protein BpHYR1_044873 [Brachionus plicatilis]
MINDLKNWSLTLCDNRLFIEVLKLITCCKKVSLLSIVTPRRFINNFNHDTIYFNITWKINLGPINIYTIEFTPIIKNSFILLSIFCLIRLSYF